MSIVCITGMHRSGTSLVSRTVNLLGVDLGPDELLMDAKPENPRGFWENQAIVRFNERLLDRLGGSWDQPPLLPAGWEDDENLDDLRLRAREVLAESFGSVERATSEGTLVGWKDPRMSVLGPFWRTVVPIYRTVVTIRDPREVAASMVDHREVEPARAIRLWLLYVLAAIQDDPDHVLVRYEDFFDDLDAVISRLARHLGVGAERETRAREEVASFFEPELRRHDIGSFEDHPEMRAAVEVFEILSRGSSSRPLELLNLLTAGSKMAQWERTIAELRGEVSELDTENRSLERSLARERTDNEQCRSERQRLQTERDRIVEERDQARRRARILGENVRASRRDQRRSQQRVQEAQRALRELELRLAHCESERERR